MSPLSIRDECFLCWRSFSEGTTQNVKVNNVSENYVENFQKYLDKEILVHSNNRNSPSTSEVCLCLKCHECAEHLTIVNDVLKSIEKELREVANTFDAQIREFRKQDDQTDEEGFTNLGSSNFQNNVPSNSDHEDEDGSQVEISPIADFSFTADEISEYCKFHSEKWKFPLAVRERLASEPSAFDCWVSLKRIDYLNFSKTNPLHISPDQNIELITTRPPKRPASILDNHDKSYDSLYLHKRPKLFVTSGVVEDSLIDANDFEVKEEIMDYLCTDFEIDCDNLCDADENDIIEQGNNISNGFNAGNETDKNSKPVKHGLDKEIQIKLSRAKLDSGHTRQFSTINDVTASVRTATIKATGILEAEMRSLNEGEITESNEYCTSANTDSDFEVHAMNDKDGSEISQRPQADIVKTIKLQNRRRWKLNLARRISNSRKKMNYLKRKSSSKSRHIQTVIRKRQGNPLESREGFIYPCGACKEKFNFLYNLRKHMRKLHLDFIHSGTTADSNCQYSQDSEIVEKHSMKTMDTDKEVKNSTLSQKNTRHKKELKCKLCQQTFKLDVRFREHEKIHLKDDLLEKYSLSEDEKQNFECHVCGQSFVKKDFIHFVNHVHFHKNEMYFLASLRRSKKVKSKYIRKAVAIYPCQFCKEKFNFLNDLRQHRLKSHPEVVDINHKNPYECKICSKKFSTTSSLEAHEKKHVSSADNVSYTIDDDGRLRCTLCGLSYKESYFRTHVRQHHKENRKLYPCDKCEKTFKFKVVLLRHQKAHIEVFNFHCNRCEEKFKVKIDLDNHNKNHEKWDILKANDKGNHFQCDICDQSFDKSGADYFVTHILFHRKERAFKCLLCEERFVTKVFREQHYKLAHPDGFPCAKCGRNFTRAGTFKNHNHDEGLNFICDICGIVFKNDYNLRRHKKTHGERSLKCDYCEKKFVLKAVLRKHMQAVHEKKVCLTCEFCGKPFYHSKGFSRHIRVHTGEKPFKCDLCDQRFSTKEGVDSHKRRVHDLEKIKCDTCGKTFNTGHNLKKHMNTHTGERPYKCLTCHKSFGRKQNLDTHMRFHTGEKPYMCDNCGNKFSRKDNLNTHVRKCNGKAEKN